MEEYLLRSFRILAEELHFGRAAERLFISQPALSKRIAQLENSLEVSLFERHNRKVALTECGRYLLIQSSILLDKIGQLKSEIKAIEMGQEGEVRLGFVGSAMQRLIPELVIESNSIHPRIGFTMEELSIEKQIEALQNETIDIGFVRLNEAPPELDVLPVFQENFGLVLPADHPIDQDSFQDLSQFKSDHFILFSSTYSNYYYEKIYSIFKDAGFDPIVKNKSTNAGIIFKLVSNGFGLAVVPMSLGRDFNLPVKLIELVNIDQKARISVIWKRSNRSKPFRKVLELIKGFWNIEIPQV